MFFRKEKKIRNFLLKKYSKPKYKKNILKADYSFFSQQCSDELHIKFYWKNNILLKANWNGNGCVIFQSSTEIFISNIINKNKLYIYNLAIEYEKMLNKNKKYNKKILKELIIFKKITKKKKNRIDCCNIIAKLIIKNISL